MDKNASKNVIDEARPTIQTIADKVGVSKATVSRALRGLPGQSEATRSRIEAVARELGYIKNPLVAALMTNMRFKTSAGYSPALAYVHCLPWGTPLHPNMVLLRDSAARHAATLGYTMAEFHLNEPGMTPNRLVSILRARSIRGVIFEHFFEGEVSLKIELGDFASVAIGLTLVSPKLHRVVVDQYSSLFLAANELRRRGYRRMGVAVMRLQESFSQFKREAALHLLHQRMEEGDRIPIHLIDAELDYEELSRWFTEYRPEVLLTTHAEVFKWIRKSGLPGADGIDYVNLAWHSMEGSCAGIAAVNQVVDQLNRNEIGVPSHPLMTFISGEWVEGSTVRSVPVVCELS